MAAFAFAVIQTANAANYVFDEYYSGDVSGDCVVLTTDNYWLDCDCSGGSYYEDGYQYVFLDDSNRDAYTLSNGAKCESGWVCPDGSAMDSNGCCVSECNTTISSHDDSHEKIESKSINSSCTCVTIMTYRCKGGYYGTVGTSSPGTCTQCPEADSIYTNSALTTKARGTSTASKNATVDTCALPTGTYYDATGTFIIETGDKCQYVN
jgi:hypothetical protein